MRTSAARSWLARRRWRRRGIALGEGSRVAIGSRLAPGTTIGHHAAVNGPAVVKGPGRVSIGAYCAIGEGFSAITDIHVTAHANIQKGLHERHGFVALERHADIAIGPACWIGDGVTVLPDARIGAGCVIAAGAVVRGEIEPYTVAGGVPARQLRERCPRDVAALLCELEWWDWTDARIARNRAFFEADIASADAGSLRDRVVD